MVVVVLVELDLFCTQLTCKELCEVTPKLSEASEFITSTVSVNKHIKFQLSQSQKKLFF